MDVVQWIHKRKICEGKGQNVVWRQGEFSDVTQNSVFRENWQIYTFQINEQGHG
jgi:hypothetical protein